MPRPKTRKPLAPKPRGAKRAIFIALSIALPITALGITEGVLRLCGFGGYPPTLHAAGTLPNGSTLISSDNAGPASYFIADKTRPGTLLPTAFVSPKPPNTLRIFCCGESAMKGFPQPAALAASSFLSEMLKDALPGKQVEVINLGTTAVASFPVLGMVREAVKHEPDLIVIDCGNNEYFGAYGVASLHSVGTNPTMIVWQRRLRSLALVQAVERLRGTTDATKDKTLMEAVIGQAFIGANDSLRSAASRNLNHHIAEMIDACKASNVPVIVCTPSYNERDLAPLGTDDVSKLAPEAKQQIERALAATSSEPATTKTQLTNALKLDPNHALLHYKLGQAYYQLKDYTIAADEFARAVDLDPMPWRPPSGSIDAIRQAAHDHGAILCDTLAAFRAASPGGCIGWELLDDHVHPTLQGQALLAKCILQSMTEVPGPARITTDFVNKLPLWNQYSERLGDNRFERYGVAHDLRVLCNIPFYVKTNPQAFARFDKAARDEETTMSPMVHEAARQWQMPQTHTGGIKRPISAMVGRVMIQQDNFPQAEQLFNCALRCVPQYTSLHLEYAVFWLASREHNHKALTKADLAFANEEIDRGKFLIAHRRSADAGGESERFVGRLYQLQNKFAEAIPYLREARQHTPLNERWAVENALVLSLIKTGKVDEARGIAREGIARGGNEAGLYRQLLAALSGGTKR